MATCTSPLSRNFQLGHRLAAGNGLEAAVADLGKLAEGVNTLKVVVAEAAERGLYMPLAQALHAVMFEDAPIADVISGLMGGEQGPDVEFALPPS